MDVLILMESRTLYTIALSRIEKIHPKIKYYNHFDVFSDLQEFLISANPSTCIIDDNLSFFNEAKSLLHRKKIPNIVFKQDFLQLEEEWVEFCSSYEKRKQDKEYKNDEESLSAYEEILSFNPEVKENTNEKEVTPVLTSGLDIEHDSFKNEEANKQKKEVTIENFDQQINRLEETKDDPVHMIVIENISDDNYEKQESKFFGSVKNKIKDLGIRKENSCDEENNTVLEYEEKSNKKLRFLNWFKKNNDDEFEFNPSKKIVAVASLVGGAGASFVSGNIAYLANLRGAPSVLIEGPSNTSLWEMFVQKESPLEKLKLKQGIGSKDIPKLHGVSFFPYPSNWPRNKFDYDLKGIGKEVLIESLKYSFVVIDISHDWINPFAEYFLSKCDSLLIVVPPSRLHVESISSEKIEMLKHMSERLEDNIYFVGNNWDCDINLLDELGINPMAILPSFKKQSQASNERKFLLQFEEDRDSLRIFNKIINIAGGI